MDQQHNEAQSGPGGRPVEVAVLAGGCFWGVQEILRDVRGVVHTEVGYTGGWPENPTPGIVRATCSGEIV